MRARTRRLLSTAFCVVVSFAVGVVAACSSFSGGQDPSVEGGEGGGGSTDAELGDSAAVDSAVPPEAAASRDFLYVFVSSTDHVGQFPPPDGGSAVNGFDGANAFCKGLADGSKFTQLRSLKWVAWLAANEQKEPWRRLPVMSGTPVLTTAYRLRDGTEVFPKGFLFETASDDAGLPVRAVPKVSIVLDEQNDSSRTNLVVWSGTTLEMQTHPSNCAGWNADIDAGSLSGLVGTTSALAIWSHSPDLGAPPCTAVNHVYCFEVP